MVFRQSLFAFSLSCLATVAFASVHTSLVSCQVTDQQTHNTSCTYSAKNSATKTTTHLYAQTAMPYALCSKALCMPVAHNSKVVHCTCPVYDSGWQGVSVGPKSFAQSKPTYAGKMLTSVTSNFSMANLKSTKTKPVTCHSKRESPWANCFGIRCEVTYKDGKPLAHCTCPVAKSKQFISVGPKSRSQCRQKHGKIWSAALQSQSQSNGVIIPQMYQKYFGKK